MKRYMPESGAILRAAYMKNARGRAMHCPSRSLGRAASEQRPSLMPGGFLLVGVGDLEDGGFGEGASDQL
jgi:hypothetical protein